MIAKAAFGRRFDRLVQYISEGVHRQTSYLGYITHDGHKLGGVYYSNLAADTPERAAREMAYIARMSRRVQKPVMQLVLSLHPSESNHRDIAERKRLAQAAQRVLAKLGLSDHQAVYAIHLEKNHLHCHVAANRVKHDGTVWPMWRSAERIQAACHAVALEMGYMAVPTKGKRVENAREVGGPHEWTAQQVKAYEKTGTVPTQSRAKKKKERERIANDVRSVVDGVLGQSRSWEEAVSKLQRHGLGLDLYRNSSRRGLQVVCQDGSRVAASAVAREFSLLALEHRWGPVPDVGQTATGKKPRKRVTAADALKDLEAPIYVKNAHLRLREEYVKLTVPVLAHRNTLLADAANSELQEVDKAKQEFRDELRDLRGCRISRQGMSFVKCRTSNQMREVVAGIRGKYRKIREDIKQRYDIPAWIEFVIGKAQKLVQDAITVLNWLRRHFDRRPIEHRLVPANGMRTPPEHFEHLGFKTSVSENGTVEYEDELKRAAFADRGDDIVVYTDEEGKPLRRHVGAALRHADAKWGGCSSPIEDRDGNFVFREHAASASLKFETQLVERFEMLPSARLSVSDKGLPGKPILPITPVRDSSRAR